MHQFGIVSDNIIREIAIIRMNDQKETSEAYCQMLIIRINDQKENLRC